MSGTASLKIEGKAYTLAKNSLKVNENTIISGNFDANGVTRLGSTLDTTSSATLRSTLDVIGFTNIHSNLDVSGNLCVKGKLIVDDIIYKEISHTTETHKIDVSGHFDVSGELDISDNTTLHSSLDVLGVVRLASTLDTSGATTLRSTLDTTGRVALHSSLDVSGRIIPHEQIGNGGHFGNNLTFDGYPNIIIGKECDNTNGVKNAGQNAANSVTIRANNHWLGDCSLSLIVDPPMNDTNANILIKSKGNQGGKSNITLDTVYTSGLVPPEINLIAPNGTIDVSALSGTINLNSTTLKYTGNLTNASDDRLKSNEEVIVNASNILNRLRPQKYNKSISDNEDTIIESGLIAQEVYYEVQELRHLVFVPADAKIINDNQHSNFDDIKNDPDYSNWGKDYAGVNYIGLISYLIKGFQEQQILINNSKNEINNLKSKIDDLLNKINN